MAFGMHFVDGEASVFEKLRLTGHGVCTKLTHEVVDDYFWCLLKIYIQSREYIIPSFGSRDFMKTQTDEMWTP